jgi:hypothetical protein
VDLSSQAVRKAACIQKVSREGLGGCAQPLAQSQRQFIHRLTQLSAGEGAGLDLAQGLLQIGGAQNYG